MSVEEPYFPTNTHQRATHLKKPQSRKSHDTTNGALGDGKILETSMSAFP
jgi:hypothetical protein